MYKFNIDVPSTPEKEDYLLVVVIDDKYKTQASFAMPRELKQSGQLKLIKSALAKVKFLNDTTIEERKAKDEKAFIKKLDKLRKGSKKDIVFMAGKSPSKKVTKKKVVKK